MGGQYQEWGDDRLNGTLGKDPGALQVSPREMKGTKKLRLAKSRTSSPAYHPILFLGPVSPLICALEGLLPDARGGGQHVGCQVEMPGGREGNVYTV